MQKLCDIFNNLRPWEVITLQKRIETNALQTVFYGTVFTAMDFARDLHCRDAPIEVLGDNKFLLT